MSDLLVESASQLKEHDVLPDDRLFLALDKEPDATDEAVIPWKILVVDDEAEVHAVTRLALEGFTYAGRPLEFVDAYTGVEAKQAMKDHPDTAIILLDVVMETDDAGLEVARYVRQELSNHFVRIILRTGQPGMAPERRVLKVYDINDYRAKTELTQDRMFSVIYTALSSYRDLIALARSRHRLVGLVNELEQFAQVASTDLQAPLKDMAGQIQALQHTQTDKLDEQGKVQLKSLWQATLRIQGVVSDLLTVANIGGPNETRTLTNCETVLDEACEGLRQLIDSRKARITHNSLPSVFANRPQLVQLFTHLISNAIKFQPGDAPEVHISVTTRGRDWLFAVADKGLGVKPEYQESIFTLYQKYHDDPQTEGSGLGLAICEKVIRWHGGKIWVESMPGQGATFYFTLPLSE